METFLHQVLSGLATGGIYASIALALVMIYQATNLVNFAQGEMAMFSTYIALVLIESGFSYWHIMPRQCRSLLPFSPCARPARRARRRSVVVVFIGLLVIFNTWPAGSGPTRLKTFPSPFSAAVIPGSKYLSAHEIGAMLITLVELFALYVFFRYTPLGLAMRAAAYNPVSSRLVGIRVGWMLALGWGLAAAIGASPA